MNAEAPARPATSSHSIWRGLVDPRVLALSLVYFGTSAGLYTLGIWAPQIIKSFGLTSMRSASSTRSRRPSRSSPCICGRGIPTARGERTWHVVIACLVACGRPCAGRQSAAPSHRSCAR